jgi:hypothetical protein
MNSFYRRSLWRTIISMRVSSMIVLILLVASVGLTQNNTAKRSLVYVPAEASCQDIWVMDAQNKRIRLPVDIEQHLRCGQASLSPNNETLALMAANSLTLYQFSSGQKIVLHRVIQVEGLEFSWSPDSTRLGLLLISQNGLLPTATQLKVWNLHGIQATLRHDYNLDVAFTCASTCGSLETGFVGREQWRYQTQYTQTLQDSIKRFAVLKLKP